MHMSTVAMLVAQLPRYRVDAKLADYETVRVVVCPDHWGGWIKLEDLEAALTLLAKLDREEAGCAR